MSEYHASDEEDAMKAEEVPVVDVPPGERVELLERQRQYVENDDDICFERDATLAFKDHETGDLWALCWVRMPARRLVCSCCANHFEEGDFFNGYDDTNGRIVVGGRCPVDLQCDGRLRLAD